MLVRKADAAIDDGFGFKARDGLQELTKIGVNDFMVKDNGAN